MCDKIYTVSELSEKLHPVFNGYDIVKAFVFGSYSRGEADDKSDIDIIVEPGEGFRAQRVCGILEEATEILNKDVDVYSINEFKPDSEILSEILRDRVILYDKSGG